MRNHHDVILLTIVLLPFSPADNSRMDGHYRQTLPVMWEVQRARDGRRSVVLFENKVRYGEAAILQYFEYYARGPTPAVNFCHF